MKIWEHVRKYWLGYSFAIVAWFFFFLHLFWDYSIYGPGLMAHFLSGEDLPHHIPLFLMPFLATAIGYLIEKKKGLAKVRRRLEAKYSALVESARDGVVILQDGKLKFVNLASMRLGGYAYEEMIGEDFLKMIAPEDQEIVKKNYADQMAGKDTPSLYEIGILKKDGTILPVELSVTVIDYEGRPADLVFVRDISERKQTEEALQESEERFKDMFENASDLIQSLNSDGKFVYVNRRWREVLGYSEGEVKKLRITDVLREDQIPHCMELFKRVIKGESFEKVEAVFKAKDGREIYVDGSVNPRLKDGKFVATRAIFRDVSERKQADVMLRESEKRLKALLDSVQAGIVVIDAETHEIVDANPIAVKMIGTAKKKVIGSVCHEYICPAEEGQCPITDMGQEIDRSERILITANGKNMPILKTVVPVMMEGRKRLVESFIDITDRRQAEDVLKKSKDELEERVDVRTSELKESRDALLNLMEDLENSHERLEVAYEELKEIDRMKSDLIANVSHELKTPLTIALSAIELARDEGREEDRANMLKMCEDAIVREERIVEDLLELATFEKEKLKLKMEPIDIVELVSGCEAEIGPSILNKGIKMETSVQKGIPRVLGDRTRLKHALSNLLSNAIKFNREGGSITVDVKKKRDHVEVAVADTGVGITKEHIGRIFDRFYQADASSRRRYGGSGIGLAIVKEIIEVHGGRIWAESEHKKGTKITFTLPVKQKKKKK